jgi:hypothetical protein
MEGLFGRILTVIFLYTTYSCSNEVGKKGFYDYSEYEDVCRLPLIQPYEALSFDDGKSWFYRLRDSSLSPFQFSEIDSVGIADSIIVLYKKDCIAFQTKSGKTVMISKGGSPVWLLIDVRIKSETYLASSFSYKNYFDSLKIKQPKLNSIRQVFDTFDVKRTLPFGWPKSGNVSQSNI